MKAGILRVEWLTLGFILGTPIIWVSAGLLWQTEFWIVSLICLPILAAFHTSLQHETIHGHPTDWGWLNELLVSLPMACIFPYRRYRDLHLKHHEDEHLTDPFEDPESYFWCENDVEGMQPYQRRLFDLNNTLAGRLIIGPFLTIIGFLRTEIARIRCDEKGVRKAWALHAIGLSAVLLIVTMMFGMPLWVYFLCVIYPALSLIALRSYAEHQAAENIGARTAIVEAHPMLALLYLNNNLHIVHHASPQTPWYALPKLYQERKPQYLAANENTCFAGYFDVIRRFAFRVKQPVAHPFLHRCVSQTSNNQK